MPDTTAEVPVEQEIAAAKTAPDFYLKRLKVKGFRSLEDTVFDFRPTLNVIIGANNSGKTALIDALRIVFNLGSFQEKEDFIRLRSSDICRSTDVVDVAELLFEATFYGADEDELSAQFHEMDCDELSTDGLRIFNLRYTASFRRDKVTGEYRYKSSQVTGGRDFLTTVSYETLDFIKSVYLAPLRDLVNDGLRLGREVERLTFSHADDAKLKGIPQSLRDLASQLISDATEGKHEAAAGKNLSIYASMYGIAENALRFMPSGLDEDMLRTLQIVFEHGHHGAAGLGLSSNGLGINNLIYASIVLSRTGENVKGDHKSFLLIEEPEAHLHPQSQDSFFEELNSVRAHQIFVTSHSPSITAKCDLDKVIVMGHPCEDKKHKPCHVAKMLEGHEGDRRYLQKFLDVTRSQILFANGAIFVEGVTEAMLLQLFSERLGCNLRSHGVEIITLGSNGGFSHFKRVIGEVGLGMRCAFLTDGDEKPGDLPQQKANLITKASEVNFEEDGPLRIYKGLGTFEFALLLEAAASATDDMRQMLREAMVMARGALLDDTNQRFANDFMDFDDPHMAYSKMKQKEAGKYVTAASWSGSAQTNTEFISGKSEFAYNLLESLETSGGTNFAVPKYIADAIRYVTKSDVETVRTAAQLNSLLDGVEE